MMFHPVIHKMKISPFLTSFQLSVLKHLGIAPSQLHRSSWCFIKCFELVLRVLRRRRSLKLFFALFEVQRRLELSNGVTRSEFVCLRGRRTLPYFSIYAESQHDWKHRYFYVVDSMNLLDEQGSIAGDKFHLGWSDSDIEFASRNYRVFPSELNRNDSDTLNLIRDIVECLSVPSKKIVCSELTKPLDLRDVVWHLDKMVAPLTFDEVATLAGRRNPQSSNGGGRPIPPSSAVGRPSTGSRLSLGAPGRAGRDLSRVPRIPVDVRDKEVCIEGASTTLEGHGHSSKCKKSVVRRCSPVERPSPDGLAPPPDRPFGLDLEVVNFSHAECERFCDNPWKFAIRMVQLCQGMHAKWKDERGGGSSSGERDHLLAENQRLTRELQEVMESVHRAQELMGRY